MSIPFNRYNIRRAAAVPVMGLILVASPVLALAQSSTGSTMAATAGSHKSRKGNANQPAPTEHQAVQPSQRLKDEPNQVKEQVAPTPSAPVKPGSEVAPGQDTPTPHES